MSIEKNYDIRFIASLALREKQIQQNYRPIIAVHKWFARRPGTLFRGLIISEFRDESIANSFYKYNNFQGKTVGDPFMGGGIPLLEANRVGCNVIGTDINPMSAWVVREEIDALNTRDYQEATGSLEVHLSQEIGNLYKTRCSITGKADAEVKYFLWVKTGTCTACAESIDFFPSYLIAKNVRHPSHVIVCHHCGDLNAVDDLKQLGHCDCGAQLKVDGPVQRHQCTCPNCGHINSAQRQGEGPPTHRVFALEYHNPEMKDRAGRLFKKPDSEDLARLEQAETQFRNLKISYIPEDLIPAGDESSRLHRWGYRRFRELFNSRQLLALETSARYIASIQNPRVRRALATNFSDLLRYQNMLCRYDTMALKSLDVFSIHGFPVGYIQVESNFLGIRNRNGNPVGSGGWINITEKYLKAKSYCTRPFEVMLEGKKKTTHYIDGEWIGEVHPDRPEAQSREITIRCASSTEAPLAAQSLDGVFTDPPYFGMVQYGELMQFCYVWLRQLMGQECPGLEQESTRHTNELTGNETAERGIEHFAEGLAAVYQRMAAALKPGAPLAFTYHHNQQTAYLAAAMGILDAGLTCTASLPCPAEMGGSIHIHGTASSIVDTVFVCRDRGEMPRVWWFDNAEELAHLIAHELEELQHAGMKPTTGDTRCIAFGHLTRMAIWRLHPGWEANRPTRGKLEDIRSAMNALATVDQALDLLENARKASHDTHADPIDPKNRKTTDAVAF